jgi:hypothetical protein
LSDTGEPLVYFNSYWHLYADFSIQPSKSYEVSQHGFLIHTNNENDNLMTFYMGTYKVRNEIETKRNQQKRNEMETK